MVVGPDGVNGIMELTSARCLRLLCSMLRASMLACCCWCCLSCSAAATAAAAAAADCLLSRDVCFRLLPERPPLPSRRLSLLLHTDRSPALAIAATRAALLLSAARRRGCVDCHRALCRRFADLSFPSSSTSILVPQTRYRSCCCCLSPFCHCRPGCWQHLVLRECW